MRELVGDDNSANLNKMSDRTNLLHLYNFMSTYIEQRSKHQPEETSPENEGEESRSMGQQQTIEEKV